MTRRHACALVAALAGAAALWSMYIAHSGFVAGFFRDEGVYIILSRALAQGAGYVQLQIPAAPAETRFPPLLPVLLSPIWLYAPSFPDNLIALKAVPALCGAAALALLPWYLVRIGMAPSIAVATSALTLLSPVTMRYATSIASELPFMLCVVATLFATERACERGRPAGAGATAGVAAGLGFLARSIGIGLVAGTLIVLWRRSDRRRCAGFLLGVVLTTMPWVAFVVMHRHAGGDTSYLTGYALDGPPPVAAAVQHVIELPATVAAVAVPGVAEAMGPHASAIALGLYYALGLIALVAAMRQPFAWPVAAMMAVALAVPWCQPRFLVPIAPLCLAALLSSAAMRRPGWFGSGQTVVLGGLLALALSGHRLGLAEVQRAGMPPLQLPDHAQVTWSDFDAAFSWVRSATGPDDVVSALHDPMIHLYTERPATEVYPWIWHPAPEQITAGVMASRTRYLIDFPVYDRGTWAASHDVWTQWIREHAALLTPVYKGPGGRVTIYRVEGPLGDEAAAPLAPPPRTDHALG